MNISASIIAISALCLLAVQTAVGDSTAAASWKTNLNSPITRWNPRVLPYAELITLGFNVPRVVPPGFAEVNARVAWIARGATLPKVPAHQAVWIRYENETGSWFEIVEARHMRDVKPWDSVYAPVGVGYFRNDMPLGSHLAFYTMCNVDILVYSLALKPKDLKAIINSCQPESK